MQKICKMSNYVILLQNGQRNISTRLFDQCGPGSWTSTLVAGSNHRPLVGIQRQDHSIHIISRSDIYSNYNYHSCAEFIYLEICDHVQTTRVR